jgi:hypothetical protein
VTELDTTPAESGANVEKHRFAAVASLSRLPRCGSGSFMLDGCMATAQDKFSALLADDFAPWLNKRGFKRRDFTFRRRQAQAWQIINFQRDKHSTANLVRFTINLGVSLDVLHEDPAWRSRGWPLEHQCDFRDRLGLLRSRQDHWWTVRPLFPTRRAVTDVLAALEQALPWLDAHADPRALLTDAVRDPSSVNAFGLAPLVALAKTIGDDSEVDAVEAELRRWQRGERSAW